MARPVGYAKDARMREVALRRIHDEHHVGRGRGKEPTPACDHCPEVVVPGGWLDSNGCQRVPSAIWGCNLFATPEDAAASARATLRPRNREFWLWRTTDGLYDWTAIPEPLTPAMVNAEPVEIP